jgi:uncharacterized protein (DUF1501 family)
MLLTRRRFLAHSALVGSVAAAAPTGLSMAFADSAAPEMLVVIFLRGAMDGLYFLAPVGDPNYTVLRKTVAQPTTGTDAGIKLNNTPGGLDMRMHGAASALKPLYDAGNLAFVHASGLMSSSRSHFEAQDKMELGYGDGETAMYDGWLTRHLQTVGQPKGAGSVVAVTSSPPNSLQSDGQAIAVPSLSAFSIVGGTANLNVMKMMASVGQDRFIGAAASDYQAVVADTVSAITQLTAAAPRNAAGQIIAYSPSNGAVYGNSSLADQLKTVAQLAKMNIGLQYATADFGGWDTHADEPNRLRNQFTQLSQAMSGFWTDMKDYQGRLTVVAMTEFGRRGKENANSGTDHGHASVFTVLGGNVNGGQVYGRWPTLAPDKLDQGLDLAITTDYRMVLAELLSTRMGNTKVSSVFPTVPNRPLGIFKGTGSTQVASK